MIRPGVWYGPNVDDWGERIVKAFPVPVPYSIAFVTEYGTLVVGRRSGSWNCAA